jgi:hypothetical protein
LIAIDTARSHVDCERRIDCSIGYAILWLMENRRKSLILLVSAAGMSSASVFNYLNCQPDPKVHFDQQRVFPALSNLIIERNDERFQIGLRCDAPGKFERRAFAEAVAGEVRHARSS